MRYRKKTQQELGALAVVFQCSFSPAFRYISLSPLASERMPLQSGLATKDLFSKYRERIHPTHKKAAAN